MPPSLPRDRQRSLFAVLPVLAVTLLLAGCGGEEGEVEAAQSGRPGGGRPGGPGGPGGRTIPIAVESASVGDASSYYTATATLEAASHAQILARTTGVVKRLLREEGDLVSAEETLLVLEDDEARTRVKQSEANLRKAQSNHERNTKMRESQLLSDEEFETSLNDLNVREADVELARLELSYTQVEAPFSGRVVRRHVDLGENVTPGTPLFEVMDVKPLLARVHIPARRMGFVTVGQEMEILIDSSDTVITGVVSLVSPIVDPTTGTVKVTAEIFEYPEGTRPGDFAQIRIVTARHEGATLVPSRALFEEAGQSVLYVVNGTTAEKRFVEKGFVDGDFTEIVDGLSPGEIIAVKGQRQLRDGIGVEVLEGPPELLEQLASHREEAPEASADSTGERSRDSS